MKRGIRFGIPFSGLVFAIILLAIATFVAQAEPNPASGKAGGGYASASGYMDDHTALRTLNPQASVIITGAEQGIVGISYDFTATVLPITTTLPITYTWQADGQDTITHTGGLTDTVSFIWEILGTQTITVTAVNNTDTFTDIHAINITDQPIEGLTAVNDSPAYLGESTTFTATITAGTNVIFTWDFGDGTTGSGETVTHTYSAPGVYTASVTATNSAGSLAATTLVNIKTYIAYLPFQSKLMPGLKGSVTLTGAPVAGVNLELRFYDGANWSTYASTTTAGDGSYSFMNVPALAPGQEYYVRYSNDTGADRLWTWHTASNTTYNATTVDTFATFDIANVVLTAPASGTTVKLPYTFTWVPRPATPTDSYEFNLYDPTDGDPYFYTETPLGYVGSYRLEKLPSGFSNGVDYGWDIWVYGPDGGSGISYYYFGVTFKK